MLEQVWLMLTIISFRCSNFMNNICKPFHISHHARLKAHEFPCSVFTDKKADYQPSHQMPDLNGENGEKGEEGD